VLAQSPRTKPDWRKRHDDDDSAWEDCIVQKDGMFFATFDPAQIHRTIGHNDQFGVALSLGIKSGQTITWKNSVPVLPQSVSTFTIPGAQALSATMQAINGAPSVRENHFNPVMLVRAVNHLRALGKDKAIAELRKFLKIARWSISNAERDPVNIDTSDKQCVFLIVRLLFEPAKPGETLPRMRIGAMFPHPPDLDKALWPLFPLVVQDDIPFILIEGVNLDGLAEGPSAHVDWAEKHCKLRARPLHPSNDPLGAVDNLMALPQTARLTAGFSGDRGVLRRQGWRMIKDLTQQPEGRFDFLPYPGYDANTDWAQRKKIAAKLKIAWDDERQAYVAR
jgi:hypothetical protein